MKIFFTADKHLDHANIIKYANRSFIHPGDLDEDDDWISEHVKSLRNQEMNKTIVEKHNAKVSEGDVVYDLGDFCFKGVSNAQYWEQQLNGTIVHIRGNHDKNNGVRTYITHAIMEFGGMIFYVTHQPPEQRQIDTLESHMIACCDIILCGHVHDLWKHKYIEIWNNGCKSSKLAINVGVDVWGMEPITIHSILKYIAKVKRGQ